MEIPNWKDNFGELNLHGKVVGDSCIDWSCDHQIVVGTNKKVVACDMSMLIAGSKTDEIGFMIENVPVITEKKNYMADSPAFLSQFESACSQTSNTKAAPDYNVYKFFLDPALYIEKYKELKGYKSIKFSTPKCTSSTGTELLAVLSSDYSLGVYQKVSAGLHAKWILLCDLSSMLIDYLVANKNYFPNFTIDCSLEFEVLREKKYSACITVISWSDVYTVGQESFCYLAACSLNGYIVIWKFILEDKSGLIPVISDVLFTNWSKVVCLTWKKDVLNGSNENATSIGIAVSNLEGQVCCQTCGLSSGENIWKDSSKKILWEEEDRLAARKMKWIYHDNESLLVAAKSHVLIAWVLNSNLEIIQNFILQDILYMPIVCLNLYEKNKKLQCFASSSDGMIAHLSIVTNPVLRLDLVDMIGTQSDIGSFRVVSPATLHGTSLSPNKAFMAMLTSRPHVRLSVQVDNEASIFMKRLISPEEASERLLQIAFSDDDHSLYKYLDLIEITRQYYSLKQKFVPALETFLAVGDIKQEHRIKKLQLRWYLLKIMKKVNKCNRRTALVNELVPARREDDERKLVEEILTIRQITKVLTTWHDHADQADSSLPVVPLLKFLSGKEEFLSENDAELMQKLRLLPALDALPVQQTCSFTSLPAEMAPDCRTASSLDGSSWPLCCLTFNMLQGYEKRKCQLSGLYSAFPDKLNSNWLNYLLLSPCIFSGAPLRRYIN